MPQRYFHKVDPKNTLILPDGGTWGGWTVIDHQNGVAAPQMEKLAAALVECVRLGRGGVSEISAAQYQDWLKKKVEVLPRRWREEVRMGVVEGKPSTPATTSAAPLAPSAVGDDFKPEAEAK